MRVARKRSNTQLDESADRPMVFNAERFFAALERVVHAREVSWRQVGKATGIQPSTLTRLGKGRSLEGANLALLSAWAGINPADFVYKPGTQEEERPLEVLFTSLRADTHLSPNAIRTIEAILSAAYGGFLKAEGGSRKR